MLIDMIHSRNHGRDARNAAREEQGRIFKNLSVDVGEHWELTPKKKANGVP